MNITYSTLFLILLLNIRQSKGTICYTTKTTACTTGNEYGNYSIKINDSRPNILTASIWMDFKKQMTGYILEFTLQSKINGKKNVLANSTLDLCDSLGGKRRDLFTWGLLLDWRNHKTLPQECPITKGVYHVNDLPIRVDLLTLFGKKGTIFADYTISDKETKGKLKKVTGCSVIVGFEVKRKTQGCVASV